MPLPNPRHRLDKALINRLPNNGFRLGNELDSGFDNQALRLGNALDNRLDNRGRGLGNGLGNGLNNPGRGLGNGLNNRVHLRAPGLAPLLRISWRPLPPRGVRPACRVPREVARPGGAQSARLLHNGFILDAILVPCFSSFWMRVLQKEGK